MFRSHPAVTALAARRPQVAAPRTATRPVSATGHSPATSTVNSIARTTSATRNRREQSPAEVWRTAAAGPANPAAAAVGALEGCDDPSQFAFVSLCQSDVPRSSQLAIAELAMVAAEVAANCAGPLTANTAVRLARDATRETGADVGPDWCLVQGHALGDLGHVEQALEIYALAREGSDSCGDAWGVALVDQNVGSLLHDCGEHERALDLLTDAAVALTQIGDDDSLRACWLSMSPALRCLDQLDEAVIVNRRLIESLRVSGDPMVLGHALVNFGHLHFELDDRPAAKECYLEALSLYRRIGSVSDQAICLSSLGHLARVDGQLELAMSLQLEAARVFEAQHRPADLAIVRYQLAVTSLHLGRWMDAKRYAELATDVPGTDLDPALALSVALGHLGDLSGAERERRGFIERQDEHTVLEEEASLPRPTEVP
jgi:tetratricopeptide (TPR) repeat protein